jgi:methionyl-tRNA formyltransferase
MAEGQSTDSESVKIVFFGSGAFAMPLAQHVHEHFGLSAVVVAKPKPRGRGRKVTTPMIAVWAEKNGIRVLSPEDPNTREFVAMIHKTKIDMFVLASYGHILGSELLGIPRYGGINVHPSLLPKYRGAAPIQRALMAGDSTTGITVILMDEKVDHGDMILQQSVTIEPDDTYETLLERLCQAGVSYIIQIIQDVRHSAFTRMPQDHTKRSYAPKITKDETVIKWDRGKEDVYNLIRALSPRPGARTTFRGFELKIIKARKGDHRCDPGVVFLNGKDVAVGVGDGSIILELVKPANKALMRGIDFRNGYRVRRGEMMV